MDYLKEINTRLGLLTENRKFAVSEAENTVNLEHVCFITRVKRGHYRFVMDDGRMEIVQTTLARLREIIRERKKHFKRSESTTWINVRKVSHTTHALQSRHWLWFHGIKKPAPVSRHYAPAIAKALGVETLDNITPLSTHGEDMRNLQLIDLGATELKTLDTSDKAAVQAHMKKWDIREYSAAKLKKLFGFKTNDRVEMTMLLSNMIWQQWLWIQAGIFEPIIGNIKTFWYENSIKSIMERVGYDQEAFKPGILYGIFERFIKLRLITYKEFGFVDNLQFIRGVGTTLPHLMVFAEKEGQYTLVNKIGEHCGCAYMASKGQIPYITMEAFCPELKESIPEGQKLTVFGFVDFNVDGHDILRNLAIKLEFYGITNYEIIPLVTLDEFSDKQLDDAGSGIVTVHEYKTEDGTLKYPAWTEDDEGRHKEVTDWYYGSSIWPGIKNKRITKRKPHPKKGEIVTIMGVDMDVFGHYGLMEIFYRKAKPWIGDIEMPPKDDEETPFDLNVPEMVVIDGERYMLVKLKDYERLQRVYKSFFAGRNA